MKILLAMQSSVPRSTQCYSAIYLPAPMRDVPYMQKVSFHGAKPQYNQVSALCCWIRLLCKQKKRRSCCCHSAQARHTLLQCRRSTIGQNILPRHHWLIRSRRSLIQSAIPTKRVEASRTRSRHSLFSAIETSAQNRTTHTHRPTGVCCSIPHRRCIIAIQDNGVSLTVVVG